MLQIALSVCASLLHFKASLQDFFLDLGFLLMIGLDEAQQGSLLVPFDIGAKRLILGLEVAEVVAQATYLALEQVDLLGVVLTHDLALSLQLSVLACALIELKFQLVDASVQTLKLLCAQELLFFLGQATQALYFLSLNLTNVLQSLILAKEHIDVLLVLHVLISDASALLLSLQ